MIGSCRSSKARSVVPCHTILAMTSASSPFCLLTVHAHPDDEASKGSATEPKYVAEGVRTLLVCCTGGEAGEVLNKAMATSVVVTNLAAIRAQELQGSRHFSVGIRHLDAVRHSGGSEHGP